jgi:thymidylate kinase
MITTVEGISCCGKSTLCAALCEAQPGAVHVCRTAGETALFLELREVKVTMPDEAIALQRRFLDLVCSRMRSIEASHARHSLVFADRDLWSFYVHGMAFFQGQYASHRQQFAELFEELIRSHPFVADLTVVVYVPYDTWRERALLRQVRPHASLFEPAFYGRLQIAYGRVCDILKERALCLDGRLPIGQLVDITMQHQRRLVAAPDRRGILLAALEALRNGGM